MSELYSFIQGVVHRETTDDKLRELLEELETNTSVEESPHQITKKAIQSQDLKLLDISSESYEFSIIGSIKSHVIEHGNYVVPCDFFITENTKERGWYVPEGTEIDSEEMPCVRNCPTLTDIPEDGQEEHMYSFEDGSELIAKENPIVTRKEENPIEITHLTRVAPIWKKRWVGKTTDGRYVFLEGRTGTCKIDVAPADTENITLEGELYFHANLGRTNIGPYLHDDEVFDLFDSMTYISFEDDPQNLPELSDEELNRVYGTVGPSAVDIDKEAPLNTDEN